MNERDVIVVGGGILGIFAAWRLARTGRHVTLLEGSGQLGGLGRGHDIGGFEVDIGVRMQPNTNPLVSNAWIQATDGAHRYLPICYRPRLGKRVDLTERSLQRLLPINQRAGVLLDRLANPEPITPQTLGQIGVNTFSRTAWEGIHRNYYASLLGDDCDELDVLNHMALGMDLSAPQHGSRDLSRAAIDLLFGGRKRATPTLGSPHEWPAPSTDPHRVAAEGFFGLYPARGTYSAFLAALADSLTNEPNATIELESPFEDIQHGNGRIQRIRAGGQWYTAHDFVFTAGFPLLFAAAEAECPPPPMRGLAQINLLVRQPVPDCLWEVHYDGGAILRTFYPQRFQALQPGDTNVIACETYHDVDQALALREDHGDLVKTVVNELVEAGTIESPDVVTESRAIVIPRAVPAFPQGYFDRLARGADRVSSCFENAHLTGTPATLQPTTPATGALAHILELAESIGTCQRDVNRASTLRISPPANTVTSEA